MYGFSSIWGNEKIINALRGDMRTQKVSHAYILAGETGSGKKQLANSFAKALLCRHFNNGDCCGVCPSCKAFESGNHADVAYVKPVRAKSLGVMDIREQIQQTIDVKPYYSDYKIYILDGDALTPQAQNGLLKILEEPPSYGVFILYCENRKALLPTILSRCVTFKIPAVPQKTVEAYLTEIKGLSKEKAAFAALYSRGSIGRAIEVSESEDFASMRQKAVSMFSTVHKRDLMGVFDMAKETEFYKEQIQAFLDIGIMWYRDLAVFSETKQKSMVIQQDLYNEIKRCAGEMALGDIVNKVRDLWETKQYLKQNSNFSLTMEVLFLRLGRQLA